MVRTWLPATQEVLCYIDNSKKKQGTRLDGMSVLSLEAALALQPEEIILAILNQETEQVIREQLIESDYRGVCTSLRDIQSMQDVRLSALRLNARELELRSIPGDVAELGVYQGAFAAEINRLFPERRIWLFDTFEGFHARDLEIEAERIGVKNQRQNFADTNVELVIKRLPHPERAQVVKGYFPESLRELEEEPMFALVSLDPDLYEPTLAGLEYFYPRLVPGGRILIHDYTSHQFEGVRMAVQKYCSAHGLFVVPLMDLHGTAVLVKSEHETYLSGPARSARKKLK